MWWSDFCHPVINSRSCHLCVCGWVHAGVGFLNGYYCKEKLSMWPWYTPSHDHSNNDTVCNVPPCKHTHIHIQGVGGRCHWADNGEVTGQELEGGLERVKRFSGGTALWLIGYGPMGVEGGTERWHHTVLRERKEKRKKMVKVKGS